MSSNISVIPFTKEQIGELIPQIARLRIEVFAEYPFLYDGDNEYEERYLQKFLRMEEAIVIAAYDGGNLIGISTGYPLLYESKHLQEVISSSGRHLSEYFCFGESVVKKPYRGQGIGKKFFHERELHVRALGHYKYICFYTRPLDDIRQPSDYRPLAAFWNSRGFMEHPELIWQISYREIGEAEETPKNMVFWIKEI